MGITAAVRALALAALSLPPLAACAQTPASPDRPVNGGSLTPADSELFAGATQHETADACLTLSFAPLDVNVPACTALLEDADSLDPATRGAVLAARAEAYEFARTYQGDHDVAVADLLAAALADLSAAIRVTTSPSDLNRLTLRRAELHEALGDRAAALADYEAVLERDPDDDGARAGAARLSASGD